MVPQRKNMVFLGTATRQVTELDEKAKEGKDDIKKKSVGELEKNERIKDLVVCIQIYSSRTRQILKTLLEKKYHTIVMWTWMRRGQQRRQSG